MIVGLGASIQLYEPMHFKSFGTMCPSVPWSAGWETASNGCLIRSRKIHRLIRCFRGARNLTGRWLVADAHARYAIDGVDMAGKAQERVRGTLITVWLDVKRAEGGHSGRCT
jgi:hypothetical protein